MYTNEICLDVSFESRQYEAINENWDYINYLNWVPGLNIAYPFMSRPQLYARCTQLGLFGITANASTIFGTHIGKNLHSNGCGGVFGDHGYDFTYLPGAIEALNLRYGGKNPGIQNVVYTNGALDSHFEFGITELHPGTFNVSVINIPSKLTN